MANYAPSEFWERAEAKDKSGKFVNKKLYYASLTIPRYPNHGPGSNGGGRICICEKCGISEWTHSKTKQFCSRKCKNEYYNDVSAPLDNPNAKRRGKVHKTCSFCGKEFTIPVSRIKEGQGVYCSSSCSNRARGFIPLWYICNTCGREFRAVTNMGSRYCSRECAANRSTTFADGTYMEALPHLLNPVEDKFDHIINLNMESILKSLKSKSNDDITKINMNLKVRMQVINKEVKSQTDGYYLNAKERKAIKHMSEIDDSDEMYQDYDHRESNKAYNDEV